MGGESGDKEAAEALVKIGSEVAKEVYGDGFHRAVKAFGDATGSAVEFGSNVVQFFVGTLDRGFKRLTQRVLPRVADIPEERRQPPSSRLLMQASVAYASLDESPDEDPIRVMFENLLLSSMDSAHSDGVHPSTVTILSQMTSDDAWILKSIGKQTSFPTITISSPAPTGDRTRGMVSTLGARLGLSPRQLLVALTNLARLGILELSDEIVATIEDDGKLSDRYEELTSHAEALYDVTFYGTVGLSPGSVSLTELGQIFLDACVRYKGG